MGAYRLYVTNSRGRIDSAAQEVLAISDEDALAEAARMVGRVPFELWDRSRLVANISAVDLSENRPSSIQGQIIDL